MADIDLTGLLLDHGCPCVEYGRFTLGVSTHLRSL
jgi:hypothetical protein